jgi:hypothetical protein
LFGFGFSGVFACWRCARSATANVGEGVVDRKAAQEPQGQAAGV